MRDDRGKRDQRERHRHVANVTGWAGHAFAGFGRAWILDGKCASPERRNVVRYSAKFAQSTESDVGDWAVELCLVGSGLKTLGANCGRWVSFPLPGPAGHGHSTCVHRGF